MDDLTLKHGQDDPGLRDFVGRDIKDVAVQDDEISGFANCDGPGEGFLKVGIGAAHGVGVEHGREAGALGRVVGLGRFRSLLRVKAAAGDADLDGFQGIKGIQFPAEGPIRAAGQGRAAVQQIHNRVEAPGPLRPQGDQGCPGKMLFLAEPDGLEIGDDAQGLETGNVPGMDQVGMGDHVPGAWMGF